MVSVHRTMRTDLWVGWKITLLLKKHFGVGKKKKHRPPHNILHPGRQRQRETLWTLAVGAEAPLRSGGLCQRRAGRRGGSGARHLHLNTMGLSRHRSPCPFHSSRLMWCSFWCGDTFTYKKKKGLYFHSTQESSICDQVSSEWILLTDGCIQNQRHLKWGNTHLLKACPTLYMCPSPYERTEKMNNKSVSQRS